MNKNFLIVLATVYSVSAFAGGGSSIGPSACSDAKYVCMSSDPRITVCVYPDNKALVVLGLENGGDFSQMYSVQGLATIGGITSYEYSQLTLKIGSGFESNDGKLPAYLTMGSAGLTNYPVGCIMQGVSGSDQ